MIETTRLRIRKLTLDDAAIIVEILNDPDFIRYVADRGVRSLEGGKHYLKEGPLTSYQQNGYGLWAVGLKLAGIQVIGMCGLLKRDHLEAPDIDFAFLPDYRGQGYAFEAAQATLAFGCRQLGINRIVAMTDPDNTDSIRLLARLGFISAGTTIYPGTDERLNLYTLEAARG